MINYTDVTVLIVDDSASQREYMAQKCRDIGACQITTAEDGRRALELIAEHEKGFDILICDLEMPGLDGIELIQILGTQKSRSGLIIVSGHEKSLITAAKVMAQDEGLQVLGTMQKPIPEKRLKAIFRLHRMQKNKEISLAVKRKREKLISVEEAQDAISNNRLVLHYQPKIDMQHLVLSGVEALVRLRSEDGTIIYPNRFISVMERNNLVDELSYEVIHQAIVQHSRWCAKGMNINISINISAVSFENEDFCQRVMTLIRKSGTSAQSLTFEVTETAVVKNLGRALAVLARLKLFGCKLSIDDYGTGYSSVKQLSNIPFDELKIDRSLIDGITRSRQLQIIFDSTLLMCNKLGLSVVAEGIEKKTDWDYLQRKGCHVCQGFFVSRPLSEPDFNQWYSNNF
ncbi:EAL domain-containing response regulator [Vibrio alginolyticus]|nr:EAL domain-containing response regulator [Vibrio alginolyticus]